MFKAPTHCEIHVGEEDWQSIPANVQTFGGLTGIPVTVVPKGGHDLGKEYVGPILDRWLEPGEQSLGAVNPENANAKAQKIE